MLIIGIIFLIISTFFVYKTAKQNGYNAILWAGINAAAYLGTQFVIGLVLGIVFAVGLATESLSDTSFMAIAAIANIITWIISIGAVILILRHVNQIKDEEPVAPPLSPDFN